VGWSLEAIRRIMAGFYAGSGIRTSENCKQAKFRERPLAEVEFHHSQNVWFCATFTTCSVHNTHHRRAENAYCRRRGSSCGSFSRYASIAFSTSAG
jgi:hypothetical protein